MANTGGKTYSFKIPVYAVLHVDYNPTEEKALIHWGVRDVGGFTIETSVSDECKGDIIDALEYMADKKAKEAAIFQPTSIDICFFPSFARTILGWLREAVREAVK